MQVAVEWTPWMNLRLRILWGRANVTIPEIALKLGRLEEEAVLARAEQLKLGVRKGFQPPAATNKPQVVARKASDSSTRESLAKRARAPALPPKLSPAETANRKAVEAERPTETGRVLITLFDLKSGMCKWPISGWGEPCHFCGNEQEPGSPYCPGHKRLAYRKPYASERVG